MRNLTICVSIILGLVAANAFAESELVLVANKNTSVKKININHLKKAYFGQYYKGAPFKQVVDQDENQDTYHKFYSEVLHQGVTGIKTNWSRLLFTGKKMPPVQLKSDAEVKAFLAEHENAIGYIDQKEVDDSVKVIEVIGKYKYPSS